MGRGGGRFGGRRSRGGRQKRKRGGDGDRRDKRTRDQDGWKQVWEMKSEAFETYYRAQNIVPENEFDRFLESLREPLPVTFRVRRGEFAEVLDYRLNNLYFSTLEGDDITIDLGTFPVPKPLGWYKHAWMFDGPKAVLRKHPALKALQRLLVAATSVGATSRQEAVSMLPPLFLDVEQHHLVLDMCAAPGSKTCQIAEIITPDGKANESPQGMVIANDADRRRCHTLVSQLSRLQSGYWMVIGHSGEKLPHLYVDKRYEKDEQVLLEGVRQQHAPDVPYSTFIEQHTREELRDMLVAYRQVMFDRVLADVPCSGDGTLRKARDMWKRWNIGMGHGLHKPQIDIATRGCYLLKVGGKLVYSTCSFNPIENEAVVAELIRASQGALRLVDTSSTLSQCTRRGGLSHWAVFGRDGTLYEKYDDIALNEPRIRPSFFPPTEEEKAEMHLERCMRFVPYDQNTGGFFVAVLEKVALMPNQGRLEEKMVDREKARLERGELGATGTDHMDTNPSDEVTTTATPDAAASTDAEKKESDVAGTDKDTSSTSTDTVTATSTGTDTDTVGETNTTSTSTVASASGGDTEARTDATIASTEATNSEPKRLAGEEGRHGPEAPFLPLIDNAELVEELNRFCDYFGIDESFPKEQLIVRGEGGKKIYFLGKPVNDFLNYDKYGRIDVINTGLLAFKKNQERGVNGMLWRVSTVGASFLRPYISKHILRIDTREFKELLIHREFKLADLEKRRSIAPEGTTSIFAHFLDTEIYPPGTYIADVEAQFDKGTEEPGIVKMNVGIWKGKYAMHHFLTKEDAKAILDILFTFSKPFSFDVNLQAPRGLGERAGLVGAEESTGTDSATSAVSESSGVDTSVETTSNTETPATTVSTEPTTAESTTAAVMTDATDATPAEAPVAAMDDTEDGDTTTQA